MCGEYQIVVSEEGKLTIHTGFKGLGPKDLTLPDCVTVKDLE